jgi:hypothetical protein
VAEHVEGPLAVLDEQHERFAGLDVLDRDRHVAVAWMPQQADVDPAAGTAVELAAWNVRGDHGSSFSFGLQDPFCLGDERDGSILDT